MLGLWESGDLKGEQDPGITLCEEEQQELKNLKNDKRRTEWLSVRLLFDAMRSAPGITIAYLPSGKPYLKGSAQKISITHSGKYTAILLCDHGQPGIDIQCFNPSIMNAPEYFLTETEQAQISEADRFIEYHRYWCAKETFYKCFSEEDPDIRNGIRIHPPAAGNLLHGTVRSSGNIYKAEAHIEQTEEYILAVSVCHKPEPSH